MKNKHYVVVWQRETDGDILIDYMTADRIREWVKAGHLIDYAIIDGEITKSIGNSTFDLGGLK
jgi:hypothetical protein